MNALQYVELAATQYQATHLLSSQLADTYAHGTIRRVLDFDRDLRFEDLQRVWEGLLARHPGLRVRFAVREGEFVQQVRAIEHMPSPSRQLQRIDNDLLERRAALDSQIGLDPLGDVLIRGFATSHEEGSKRLCIEVHHALVDEQSLFIISQDLSEELSGTRGRPPMKMGLQRYLDAMKELNFRSSSASECAGAHWRHVLREGRVAAAPLWPKPLGDRTEPTSSYRLEVDPDRASRWVETARSLGISFAATVHASLAVLYYRYGLGSQVTVGVPISLRDAPCAGFDVIGLFLNVLPVIVSVDGTDSLASVMRRSHDEYLALHDQKFTGLTDVPRFAGISRSEISASPKVFFSTLLSVHHSTLQSSSRAAGGLTRLGKSFPGSHAHIDVEITSSSVAFELSWQSDRVPWPRAEDFLSHLARVLDAMCTDPGEVVTSVPLLDESEESETVRRLNGRLSIFDPPQVGVHVIHEAVATWTECTEASLVADNAGSWSASELIDWVDRIRLVLRSCVKGPGSRVGVAFGRSRWQVAAALATWCERLTYVPLDTYGPRAHNEFICRDADVEVIVGGDAPQLRELQADFISLRDIEGFGPAASPLPLPELNLSDDAYIMYTSGSSGRPKGVIVSQANLSSFDSALVAALPELSSGCWLAETAPTFDISIVEMILPVIHGQTVTIADPNDTAAAILDIEFDHRQCTPTRARQLLAARALGDPMGHWSKSPRTWLIGGEMLPGPLLTELVAAFPSARFVNMYGPTEATIWSTYYPIHKAGGKDVPLGGALQNTLLWIVDGQGRLVPPGVQGELVIGGDGVAANYVGGAQLADVELGARLPAELPAAKRRVYHTGDQVILAPGDQLLFRGRTDGQVKIRGYRVETSGVERAILAGGYAAEAVVAAYSEEATGQSELLTVIVPQPGRTFNIEDFRRHLRDVLPEPMIPTRWLALQEMPRLSSGKIDRVLAVELCQSQGSVERLPDQQAVNLAQQSDSSTLQTITETTARLLSTHVAPSDDFFAIGGNSLNALALVAALREGGLELHIRDVFEAPVIEEMARRAVVANNVREGFARNAPVHEAVGLLPMQADFFDTYDGDRNWFLTPAVFRLEDESLDIGSLADRISNVLAKYEALRSQFSPDTNGVMSQRFPLASSPSCDYVRNSSADAEELRFQLKDMANEIDLHRQSSVARVLDTRQGRFLAFVFHHLVVDALSVRALMSQVSHAVQSSGGNAPARDTAPLSVVIPEMHYLADSDIVLGEAERWLSMPIADGAKIPLDHPNGRPLEATSRSCSISLGMPETSAVVQLARRRGLQIGDVVAAAAAVALIKHFDLEAISIDNAIHGRDLPLPNVSLAESVGWIAVNVPILFEHTAVVAGVELEHLRDHMAAGIGRGHGYSLLRHLTSERAVRTALRANGSPIVSCNYVGSIDAAAPLPGLSPFPVNSFVSYDPTASRSHVFDIDCMIATKRLVVQMGFSESQFQEETVTAVLAQLESALRGLIGIL